MRGQGESSLERVGMRDMGIVKENLQQGYGAGSGGREVDYDG